MFRNQYDSDVTVWSPAGRLHQVEYAVEAVKQGSATVGIKSNTHAVVVALKRASSDLAAHQKKIITVDQHMGVSISGLTADARLMVRWMRTECLNYQYARDSPLPIGRLMNMLGNKMQLSTQRYDRRPYGVGLLVAGYDSKGPHLYQTCPSANYYDCKAMAIGARSQSARTYMEKHLDEFSDSDLNQLVAHALRALRDTLPAEMELTNKNVSIGIVGKDYEFVGYDDETVDPFLNLLDPSERKGRGAPAGPGVDGDDAPPPEDGPGGEAEMEVETSAASLQL
ncbi:proteasome subunit alpha type-1 [Folsomia candida]|uniref:Proteasome subunit alpha type n=1 Tax=Folsomia candida TaxID=158441 RepID=A0A226F5X4_FOLCA|nr:proteasome subunit alpha type-1 [Folsomia candida]OXA64730.1 Proteasome subunit alpha type-1 [Folsomia candida]